LEEGRGTVGAKETWGTYEWARGEVDRNRNTQTEVLARVSPTEPYSSAVHSLEQMPHDDFLLVNADLAQPVLRVLYELAGTLNV